MRWLFWSAVVVATSACGDDANPPTFHEPCDRDASVCAEPFECEPVKPGGANDAEPIPICTMPCKRDSECPYLGTPNGHCGVYQAVCIDGFCQGWCV